ncbi:hypothetical protein V0U79_06165 [Hyphobacterium sp. HN65]|uniref:Uncharacterized protein n=1 Tax=Hyphobacterium lacteum TaxID=3116575 RepID=A0ABU7LRI9_9PROT|nr:hypothetical protein [Hyphobacterium sp. HN65]MEE2525944.1 hypothetical protein [Hyphobacterium sp. HN65]
MILSRIATALRQQNWVAVALEFVIVIAGVVIGFQITAWNGERADRRAEARLLERLHQEVQTLLDIQSAELAEHLPRAEILRDVHPLLFDAAPERMLTDTECRVIGMSHWLPAPTDELPVLEETISTGRSDLIASERVRASLREFAILRDRARRQYAELVNELFRLAARHPEAIWNVRTPLAEGQTQRPPESRSFVRVSRRAGDGYDWTLQCDLAVMRRDRAFQAEYVDNVSRLNSFVERYEEMLAVLTDLEAAIAGEPGTGDRP